MYLSFVWTPTVILHSSLCPAAAPLPKLTHTWNMLCRWFQCRWFMTWPRALSRAVGAAVMTSHSTWGGGNVTFLGSQEEAGERRFTYSPKLAACTALLVDEEQKLSSNLGCFCFYIEELPECLGVLQSVISRDLRGRSCRPVSGCCLYSKQRSMT